MSNREISVHGDDHPDLGPARADLLRRLEAGERIPASAPGSRILDDHPELAGWIDDEPTIEIEARK